MGRLIFKVLKNIFFIIFAVFLFVELSYTADKVEKVTFSLNNVPLDLLMDKNFDIDKWGLTNWFDNFDNASMIFANNSDDDLKLIIGFELYKAGKGELIKGETARNNPIKIPANSKNNIILLKNYLVFDDLYVFSEFSKIVNKYKKMPPGVYDFYLYAIDIATVDTVGNNYFSFNVAPPHRPIIDSPSNGEFITNNLPEFSLDYSPIGDVYYTVKVWKKFVSQSISTAISVEPVFVKDKVKEISFILINTENFRHGQIYICQVEVHSNSNWVSLQDSCKSDISEFIFLNEKIYNKNKIIPIYLSEDEQILLEKFLKTDKLYKYLFNNFDFQYIYGVSIEDLQQIFDNIHSGKIIYVESKIK